MALSWGALGFEAPRRVLERDWRWHDLPPLESDKDSWLAYGAGRSYGDSCINSGASHLSTGSLNRFISFDSEAGILECEAGVTFEQILEICVPRGWFLPVVPGTAHITLGGAIANDVHGKNHHCAGTFGCHVQSLTLLRSDGARRVCSSEENSELFSATVGGLGLTGVVLSARIALIPITSPLLEVENRPFESVQQFISLSEESADWTYSVAWLDTSAAWGGRGIFSRARHASAPQAQASEQRSASRMSVPLRLPLSLVNRWTSECFNRLYFALGKRRPAATVQHYRPFFFPLDGVQHWNRLYGKSGFYQYQCVLPTNDAAERVDQILSELRIGMMCSPLSVVKMFGDIASPGMLSFPRPGLTLAVDLPAGGKSNQYVFERLDQIVASAGGALYPAKDARMPSWMFRSGYSALDRFKEHLDPQFSSSFWRRMQ